METRMGLFIHSYKFFKAEKMQDKPYWSSLIETEYERELQWKMFYVDGYQMSYAYG